MVRWRGRDEADCSLQTALDGTGGANAVLTMAPLSPPALPQGRGLCSAAKRFNRPPPELAHVDVADERQVHAKHPPSVGQLERKV